MLDARGIPSFVRGGGIGGLLPGVQISAYNTRDIMVPEEKAAEALELVRDLDAQQSTPEGGVSAPRPGKLRNLFEFLLFGWFVPSYRADRRNSQPDGQSHKHRSGP
jgi:hypothetical protein